jgi:hypothetical protein
MKETLFCYSCRTHHPLDRMEQFHTRQGLRWRCRRTIEAAKCSVAERDAFGRQQSAINREVSEKIAERLIRPYHERPLQR